MQIDVAEEQDAHEIVTNATGRGRENTESKALDRARRRSIAVVRAA